MRNLLKTKINRSAGPLKRLKLEVYQGEEDSNVLLFLGESLSLVALGERFYKHFITTENGRVQIERE